jgi:hypothetical protein
VAARGSKEWPSGEETGGRNALLGFQREHLIYVGNTIRVLRLMMEG